MTSLLAAILTFSLSMLLMGLAYVYHAFTLPLMVLEQLVLALPLPDRNGLFSITLVLILFLVLLLGGLASVHALLRPPLSLKAFLALSISGALVTVFLRSYLA